MATDLERIIIAYASLLGCLGCAVAPSADDTATDTTSADTTNEDSASTDSDTTGGEVCMPQSAVEIEIKTGGLARGGILAHPCTVTSVEQDQQDARKWTF